MKKLIEEYCKGIGITVHDLLGRSRITPLPVARQILWKRLRKVYSLSSIGRMFSGRDHSTVIAGIIRANELIDVDDYFAKKYDNLLSELFENYKLSNCNKS